MLEIQKIVANRLEQMGVSAIVAAERAGLKRDALRSIVRGQQPTYARLKDVCQALGLEFYIGLPEDIAPEGEQPISYIGRIAAGGGDNPNDEARLSFALDDQKIIAPPMITQQAATKYGGLHAAKVFGDSMAPSYSDGDLVMFYPDDPISRRPQALIGKDCAIVLEDETMLLKRIRYGDDGKNFNLESINPRWGIIVNQAIIKACPIRYVQRNI